MDNGQIVYDVIDFSDMTIGHLKRILNVPETFEVMTDWKNGTFYILSARSDKQ